MRAGTLSAFDETERAAPSARRRRGRAPRRRRSPAQRALLLAIWLAAGAFGLAAGLRASEPLMARLHPEVLAVESVAVVGAERARADELVRALGLAAGTPVLSVDAPELQRRIESHPWVASARVALLRPGRVLVAVEERDPVAVAVLGNPPTPYWLDGAGVPFLPVGGADVGSRIAVLGPEDARPGEADPRFEAGARLAADVVRLGIPGVREVQVARSDPASLPALLLEGGARVALGAGDHAAKLARLAALLAAPPPELASAREIDLRFGDRMVLRSGLASFGGAGAAGASGGAPPPNPGPRG